MSTNNQLILKEELTSTTEKTSAFGRRGYIQESYNSNHTSGYLDRWHHFLQNNCDFLLGKGSNYF